MGFSKNFSKKKIVRAPMLRISTFLLTPLDWNPVDFIMPPPSGIFEIFFSLTPQILAHP